MEKTFCTDDHAAVIEANDGHAFTYFDRSDRMTKAASDVISKSDIANHMPPSTHFGVHLITMGAEEDFGFNRNGDSASRRSLELYHPTFEKFGCVYREHQNRDPKTQGVGDVKLARYNSRMGRGELLVWVSKDKAPDMYKTAKEGKELSWSMSMRLPHDECSCCKKKSRTTADYCRDLKDNMMRFVPGFEKYAYARNEDNVKFFDISEVKRRADRIATYLGYFGDPELMAKAAAAGEPLITGADWARHFFGNNRVVGFLPWEDVTLEKLAAAEEFVRHADAVTLQTLACAAPATLTRDQIETLARPDFRSVGGELAKQAMFINFQTFASMITGRDVSDLRKDASFLDVEALKLPELLSGMLGRGGCCCGEDAADSVAPDEVGCAFSPDKDPIDKIMHDAGDSMGMLPKDVNDRVMKIVIVKSASLRRSSPVKVAFDPVYDAMAEAYGHYLVKAAHIAKDLPGVSEPLLFRALAASLLIQLA